MFDRKQKYNYSHNDSCKVCHNSALLFDLPDRDAIAVYCPVCGEYIIAISAAEMEPLIESERAHLLSAATRSAAERGSFLTINVDNLDLLIDTARKPKHILDYIDALLRYASQFGFGKIIQLDEFDYSLLTCKDNLEVSYIIGAATDYGFVEHVAMGGVFEVKPRGWERLAEIEQNSIKSDQAFVAMWFGDEVKSAYLEGIKPALQATGFSPLRIDESHHNDKIDDRIISEIRRSGLLIADFTAHRGGVYFEAGFAMGLGIPVIWTCHNDDIGGAHFDTRQYNHITWETPAELCKKLEDRIRATIPGRA